MKKHQEMRPEPSVMRDKLRYINVDIYLPDSQCVTQLLQGLHKKHNNSEVDPQLTDGVTHIDSHFLHLFHSFTHWGSRINCDC